MWSLIDKLPALAAESKINKDRQFWTVRPPYNIYQAVLMKPVRAFPFPINIGNDICQISRIYGILSGPRAVRFVNRVLSPEELAGNDARISVLNSVKAQRPGLQDALHKANKTSQPHEQIAADNPEMWSCAAFIAGR
jgi:holo-[acyl-carrier protein] synthase